MNIKGIFVISLVLFVGELSLVSAYTIVFDTDESPPSTVPTDFKLRRYSVAVNSITSVALKATIQDDNNDVVTEGDVSSVLFDIESLDSTGIAAASDTWLTGGGELCVWGIKAIFPMRMQKKYWSYETIGYSKMTKQLYHRQYNFGRTICEGSNKLVYYPADRGMLVVDGMIHKHTSATLPPNPRKYKLTAHLPDGTSITAETSAFILTDAANAVQISVPPPASIVANQDFGMTVNVLAGDGSVLTDGTDSVLFAELQVEWAQDVMEFYDTSSHDNILYKEGIRLRGNVEQKQATYNYVSRVQMVNGVATFAGLQILDVTPAIRLNITLISSRFPFMRRPNVYTDLADAESKVLYDSGKFKIYYMNMTWYDANAGNDPAVILTSPIEVTAQVGASLSILNAADITATQVANFPIENAMSLEVLDSGGRRVYSGPDSTMDIALAGVASGGEVVCISSDAAVLVNEGLGMFNGSICAPVANTKLVFTGTDSSGVALTPVETIEMTFTSDIALANFIAMKYSGTGTNIGAHLDSMIRFAKDDVNDGTYGILPGRTLKVHSFDTKNDLATTIRQYKAMQAIGKAQPHEKIRGVIGFGSNSLAEKLQPFLTADEMPQLATREDKYDFGNKEQYPYYNRISWDMGAMSQSIMLACKNRKWTKTVLLRSMDVTIDNIFHTKAKEFGIEISEITIPILPMSQYGNMGVLKPELDKLKAAKTKIVWIFVRAPLLWKLIREAAIAGVAPMNGYQWLQVGVISWHIPFANQFSLCTIDPICTVVLTGNNGFAATYDLKGLRTAMWEPVLTKHIKKDRMYYRGSVPKHTLIIATASFALGYDALLVYAHALHSLIDNTKTVTGTSLALAMRTVSFTGLSSEIALNEKGNRPGYYGFSAITDPHPPELGTQTSGAAMIARYFDLESETSEYQLELAVSTQWPLNLPGSGYTSPVNPYTLPNTEFVNKRRFNGTDGMIDGFQDLIPIPPSTAAASFWVEIEEDCVAPFYCTNGCGGGKLDVYDITIYANGDCVDMEQCLCHNGWYGETCEEMICICKNGHCDIPEICICDAGWTGDICQTAICTEPCDNGKCTGPDMCTCNSGYVGGTCGTVLAVAVVVPIVVFLILAVAGFFFARWFMRRHALAMALKNLDWRVNWEEEVQTGVGAVSMVSTAQEEFSSKKNFISWKAQRCYSQKFDCDTLNVNDEALRLEIVHLKEIRHNNLIHFVGACLEWPSVCILTETCPKGSLEDILANDTVKLGWDFKYSLLKDICRGMDYLQRTAIESHGRLNSRNCLVDNRWTCKISGFGAPTIRYSGSRKKREDSDAELTDPTRSLFWTPPELLPGCKSINDVGKGTPYGDVYSFAIIMTEVLAREEPYTNELGNLSPEEILILVRDKNAPEAARAKRKWYETGGDTTKQFRPKIEDSDLPDDYSAKSGFRKLIEQDWHESQIQRLSFRQNLDKLNEIHPIKGELIDNLVNMLEKYSSNLENIVMDRTKELMVEKAKTEQLVSQMLPKKVVEDLKHGRTVEPESFECVTIFFSDLVGFTAIAKESTPLQVVDLLNDLYTTFDAILDNYDVYKVETIGDAYMVVSGLPVRNGDLHAGEIASVSLDLLSSMCDFKIRHLPGTVLQLRIGMHSGPAVAGVVGLKMPRYCLFGDTVNTASRMESSSIALRIHMSEATANILFKLGGYHLDCRGEREVKGKGTMTTYWLEGKDGFNKKLPGADMAVSLSKHEFK